MSASEILLELPKLSHAERREISRRLLELESERDALQFAAEATEATFLELEKIEAEDARTDSR